MKALTICQPYAELIMRGEKRVENRTWYCSHRGPLLIHAGKSRNWLKLDTNEMDVDYRIYATSMDFGAIIGAVSLIDCISWPRRNMDSLNRLLDRWPWLANHSHAEGPFCMILEDAIRFAKPIPYRGAQGLFDVSDSVVEEAIFDATSR